MKELTLNETACVSGGAGYRDWENSVCSTADSNSSNSSSTSWGMEIVNSWRDITDNAADMHDRGVRAMTDIMCRVTNAC